MKVEHDNPETTKTPLESQLAPGTVYHFPGDPATLYMRTDGDGDQACVVLGDPNDYWAGQLFAVDPVPVVVVDATLRVRG